MEREGVNLQGSRPGAGSLQRGHSEGGIRHPRYRSGDLGGLGSPPFGPCPGNRVAHKVQPGPLMAPHPRESQSPAKSRALVSVSLLVKPPGGSSALKLGVGQGQKHTTGAARTRPTWQQGSWGGRHHSGESRLCSKEGAGRSDRNLCFNRSLCVCECGCVSVCMC